MNQSSAVRSAQGRAALYAVVPSSRDSLDRLRTMTWGGMSLPGGRKLISKEPLAVAIPNLDHVLEKVFSTPTLQPPVIVVLLATTNAESAIAATAAA